MRKQTKLVAVLSAASLLAIGAKMPAEAGSGLDRSGDPDGEGGKTSLHWNQDQFPDG